VCKNEIMETKFGSVYSENLNELRGLIIGYNHDHCYHKYFGLTENVPEELKKHVIEDAKYVFIYEEDIPINNAEL